jgi:hypothetical protein
VHQAPRMASNLIQRTVQRGSETRGGSTPAGVSLRWAVRGPQTTEQAGQAEQNPEQAPLSSTPHQRNGRLDRALETQRGTMTLPRTRTHFKEGFELGCGRRVRKEQSPR